MDAQPPRALLEYWLQEMAPPTAKPVVAKEDNDEVENAPESELSTESQCVHHEFLLTIARNLMACEFEVLFNQHQYPDAPERGMAALDLIEKIERLCSVYVSRSDFSLLNRFGAERPIGLAYDACQLLSVACDMHVVSDGAFDITAGSLSEAWGFSRRDGRMPTQQEIDNALDCVGSVYLQLDRTSRTAKFSKSGVKVNPGGIGKGYALDQATKLLGQHGLNDFMIHGGLSSVVARGHRRHGEPQGWSVALKHPWRWEETLGTIRLNDQALGTSGSGKQFFHFGGKRYSHIIDPRTGWPAQGMMSTTVVCSSGAVADALATALFVMGPDGAMQFADKYREIGMILIFADAKSGRQRIEVRNIPEGTWLPAR